MRVGREVRQRASPSAPASSWLVLSWLSVVLTAWPPRGSPAKCHITSAPLCPGLAFNHFHTHIHLKHHPSLPPLNTTWKWEPFVCFSLFIALCFSSVGWGDLPCAVVLANGIANIKQYSVITLHAPSTGRSSIFVELQLNIIITQDNFIDGLPYLSLSFYKTKLSFDCTWQSWLQRLFVQSISWEIKVCWKPRHT